MPDRSPYDKRGRLAVKIMAIKTVLFVLLIIVGITVGAALRH